MRVEGNFCHVPAHTQQLTSRKKNVWPHNTTHSLPYNRVCLQSDLLLFCISLNSFFHVFYALNVCFQSSLVSVSFQSRFS